MKKLFLFLILFSSICYGKNYGEFSCHEYQYGYINGIKNLKKKQAIDSAKLIKDQLKINKHIEPFFNQSQGAAVDLIRSLFQKLEESKKDGILGNSKNGLILLYSKMFLGDALSISDKSDDGILKWVLTDNQKTIDEAISQVYDKDKKLIIFSHSQGNLYANKSCENLGRSTFENIQIATPASEITCGEQNNYTSIHSDEMIKTLSHFGKPLSTVLGLKIKSPLKTNSEQQRVIKNKEMFEIHSVENYLINPDSLTKITNQHNSIVKNSFHEPEKTIIKSENIEITCNNLKDYVGSKIEIPRGPATVLDKPIKVSKDYPEKLYIEQKGDKFLISSFDLDSWFANKFWYLYVLAFPFGLILAGSMASAIKKSEEYSNKDNK